MRSRQTEQDYLRSLTMKATETIKTKVRFCISAVVRAFWRIMGRKYFYGYDEPFGSDYGAVVEGYYKDGKIYITKTETYDTHANLH